MIKNLFDGFGLKISKIKVWAMRPRNAADAPVVYASAEVADKMFKEGTHENVQDDPLNESWIVEINYKGEVAHVRLQSNVKV